MLNTVHHGDCLKVMKEIKDKSIDLILCDLPYGTTACKWDTVIPFEPLWEHYERIIKDNGAIVLFGAQPFTTDLINSNKKLFRYELVWDKVLPVGFLSAKKMPLRLHENILVFYKALPTYNPIMTKADPKTMAWGKRSTVNNNNEIYGNTTTVASQENGMRYPTSIIKFSNASSKKGGKKHHPTQKAIALCEWLISTYSNEGDLVLDNCAGGGTTGRACKNLNRSYILIEKEREYIDIIHKRLEQDVLL